MRLPHVHLRDMFWLILVAALAVGWWVDHAKLAPLASEVKEWRFRIQYYEDSMTMRGYNFKRTGKDGRGLIIYGPKAETTTTEPESGS